MFSQTTANKDPREDYLFKINQGTKIKLFAESPEQHLISIISSVFAILSIPNSMPLFYTRKLYTVSFESLQCQILRFIATSNAACSSSAVHFAVENCFLRTVKVAVIDYELWSQWRCTEHNTVKFQEFFVVCFLKSRRTEFTSSEFLIATSAILSVCKYQLQTWL